MFNLWGSLWNCVAWIIVTIIKLWVPCYPVSLCHWYYSSLIDMYPTCFDQGSCCNHLDLYVRIQIICCSVGVSANIILVSDGQHLCHFLVKKHLGHKRLQEQPRKAAPFLQTGQIRFSISLRGTAQQTRETVESSSTYNDAWSVLRVRLRQSGLACQSQPFARSPSSGSALTRRV
jgi:hypothetical protein